MMDDPYNFVDEDDSMQKPLQGPPMHPFTPNGYNMSQQQSSQQHQSLDYSSSLVTQQPSSAAPTPDKNVKKRGRKKKGDEIRYVVCLCITSSNICVSCVHIHVIGISFLENFNIFNNMRLNIKVVSYLNTTYFDFVAILQ